MPKPKAKDYDPHKGRTEGWEREREYQLHKGPKTTAPLVHEED